MHPVSNDGKRSAFCSVRIIKDNNCQVGGKLEETLLSESLSLVPSLYNKSKS